MNLKTDITGTLFVKDNFRLDYCLEESVRSLLPFCDEIIVLDCGSRDGTQELIRNLANENTKIKAVYDHPWDVAYGYHRLRIIADDARRMVKTNWHFMLQADEVVHEDSVPFILDAVKSGCGDRFFCRRYNLFGGMDHYIRFGSSYQPCNDQVVRLGKQVFAVVGDAENIDSDHAVDDYLDKINIVHYGFVRTGSILLDKAIEMQEWFGLGVDSRLLAMKKRGEIYESEVFISKDYLDAIPFSHPKVAQKWVDSRRNDLTRK